MKIQTMLAHIGPHFHAWGAGFFLVLALLIVAIALFFASGSKNKDK